MGVEDKKQRLLPSRQDSAQDEPSPAPRFGSLTGRGTYRISANRPQSSGTPEVWQQSGTCQTPYTLRSLHVSPPVLCRCRVHHCFIGIGVDSHKI